MSNEPTPNQRAVSLRFALDTWLEIERERQSRTPIPSRSAVVREIMDKWAERRAKRRASVDSEAVNLIEQKLNSRRRKR